MAEHAERTGAIRQGPRGGRAAAANERLEQSVSSHPLLRRLLDLGVLAKAVAIAIVLTLLVAVALSPKLAAVVLVLSFFIAWYALAERSESQRRPTRDSSQDE